MLEFINCYKKLYLVKNSAIKTDSLTFYNEVKSLKIIVVLLIQVLCWKSTLVSLKHALLFFIIYRATVDYFNLKHCFEQ